MVERYLTVLVSTQITISMFRVHQFNKKFKKTAENSKDPLYLPFQVALFSVEIVKQGTCESPFQMKLARPPMNNINDSYVEGHFWKCKEMFHLCWRPCRVNVSKATFLQHCWFWRAGAD